jgi:hypothetical protein
MFMEPRAVRRDKESGITGEDREKTVKRYEQQAHEFREGVAELILKQTPTAEAKTS